MTKARKLKYGVGIKDTPSNGKATSDCPYYRRWASMLERCYSTVWTSKYPSYKGCSVCEEWLTFSNFKAWMETQDWEGKQLDKDLLGDGKLYSPETCCFITGGLNKFLTLRSNDRGSCPVGVSKVGSRFKVQVSNPTTKKLDYFGCYKTEEEALVIWKQAKLNFANKIPELVNSPALLVALENKIKEL